MRRTPAEMEAAGFRWSRYLRRWVLSKRSIHRGAYLPIKELEEHFHEEDVATDDEDGPA